MRLVDGAAALVVALRLARVDPAAVDAALEKARASYKKSYCITYSIYCWW
jgi:hypothetical protein